MCVSNHFIEQQSYNFSEKIRENSLYKYVGTQLSESDLVYSNKPPIDHLAFVTKVILEDKDGTLYYVAPNPNGLRFAKQEVTFKEYQKLQKLETRKAIAAFLGIIGFFGLLMVSMMKYLV